MNLREEIVSYAREIGLDLIGFTNPEPFDRYLTELDQRKDYYATRYAYRIPDWTRLAIPREVIRDAASVVVIGYAYRPLETEPGRGCGKLGRIVTYGHLGILTRARLLRQFLRDRGFKAEMGAHRKEAAVRAGLGSIGKNNLVLNSEFGSWVAYQSIVTNAEIAPDKPAPEDICKDCDLCLRACPTSALYAPRRLDPTRCVSCLLTSETIPEHLWPALGIYILGCDVCQEVCPKNQEAIQKPAQESLLPNDITMYPPLKRLLCMNENEFAREVIAHIHQKISGGGTVNRLMTFSPMVQRALMLLLKVFSRGKEVLPETFVHASGNLNIYKRNALLAAGNLGEASLKDYVSAYLDDINLGPQAKWAMERLHS